MPRLLPTIAVAAFASAALLACDNEPLSPGSGAGGGTSLPQASVVAKTADIQALVDAQFAAWAAKDAVAIAATYAEDAKLFTTDGGMLDGRQAIRDTHAFLYGTFFAGSTETQVITDIRFLTGTIAAVHLNGALSGYAFLPPSVVTTEPGVLRTTKTWLVTKRGGAWEIVVQHMAPVAPAP